MKRFFLVDDDLESVTEVSKEDIFRAALKVVTFGLFVGFIIGFFVWGF